MEILVPRPPKESFNKQRPVSDLIRKQVEHFRHVESKNFPRRNAPDSRRGMFVPSRKPRSTSPR